MGAGAAAFLRSVRGEAIILEDVRAEASINDLLVEVVVAQRYRNPESSNIEAVYTFPLPSEATLLSFEVEIGNRKLAGSVVEKAESERRYEDAISHGDAALLLERAGPELYTTSVGNLLPGETATIRFRYALFLRWNGDHIRLTMPTTIAPRYGNPVADGLSLHQIPQHAFDAERGFGLRVVVRGVLKDARFNSPSHSISVNSKLAETDIELNGQPAMDRDFVLVARSCLPDVASALLSCDRNGWVASASFRPEIPETEKPQRRSVKLVVDCSGSMAGDSIGQARVALDRILDGLREGDLFEIIAFGATQRPLFGREMSVSEVGLARARRFVRNLDAVMGGTEIGAALDAAYACGCETDLPRDLMLITDGSVWDDGSLIVRAKRSGHRIFTVGVGSAVSETFLRGLADSTGGACELVAPREDMAERILRHFQRMYAPRAESVEVHWPIKPLHDLRHPIDAVYGGDTLQLFAWFAERPEGEVRLDVTLENGHVVSHSARILPIVHTPQEPLSPVDTGPSTLARLAAASRLALINEDTAGTELAVHYQLTSQWTNYVVHHVRADTEKPTYLPQIRKVPHVIAAGWNGMGIADQFDRIERRCVPVNVAMRTHRGVSIRALMERLNQRQMPPFPTFDELENFPIPNSVMVVLRELVDQGRNEEDVTIALLYLLAESREGKGFDRAALRSILKAFKERRSDLPLDAVANALRDSLDWNSSFLRPQSFPVRGAFRSFVRRSWLQLRSMGGRANSKSYGDRLSKFDAAASQVEHRHDPFVANDEPQKISQSSCPQGERNIYAIATRQEPGGAPDGQVALGGPDDELFNQALAIVLRDRKASISYIQRRLSTDYYVAVEIIERMEREGVISLANNDGKREVLW